MFKSNSVKQEEPKGLTLSTGGLSASPPTGKASPFGTYIFSFLIFFSLSFLLFVRRESIIIGISVKKNPA